MKKLRMFLALLLVLAFATTAYAERNVNDAVNWAEDQIGKTSWSLRCLKFTANAYGNAHANFDDAWIAWNDNGSTFGDRKKDNNFNDIPKGALVFFGTGLHPHGHVGFCIGNGKIIHAWTDKVREDDINDSKFTDYAGWRWPGAWVITDFSDDDPIFVNLRIVGNIGWYPVNKTCVNAQRWYRVENGEVTQSFGNGGICYSIDPLSHGVWHGVVFGADDLPLQCTE